MWLAQRYGTQFGLEEATIMVAKHTLVVISGMLNMVKVACMGELNA